MALKFDKRTPEGRLSPVDGAENGVICNEVIGTEVGRRRESGTSYVSEAAGAGGELERGA